MLRRTRSTLRATAVGAVLLATGCSVVVTGTASPAAGSGPAPDDAPARPTPTAPAPSADAVAWVDEICSGLLPFVEFSNQDPPPVDIDEPDSRVRSITALSDYAGQASAVTRTSILSIQAVGPGPTPDSDQLVDGLIDTLTTVQGVFDDVQHRADAIDPTDSADLAVGLPDALAPLDTLNDLPDPAESLRDDPELSAAADRAPTCQRVGLS